MKKKERVIKSHKPFFEYHMELTKGELLKFERKKTEVAGWIWCTTTGGKSCWIPEAWVEIEGEKARLQRDYSSKELAVKKDDTVLVELSESGWILIATYNEEIGWIPEECIKQA